MKYDISHNIVSGDMDITLVLGKIALSEGEFIEIQVMSLGAGIRRISYVNTTLGVVKLLTLSYDDIAESCHNDSLAGLTIGPNAGRLKAKEDITFIDGDDTLTVNLSANEDGYKQIHGGEHNLAKRNWEFDGVNEIDGGIEVIFSTKQENGLDGWPGNRKYEVKYIIGDGQVKIRLQGSTDSLTYINMTNHTYWIRDGLQLDINSDEVVVNKEDFLPIGIEKVQSKSIAKDAVLNNAFLTNNNSAAMLTYTDIPLKIEMNTDAPAVVVYTGDYLDELSGKASAIALEPQELHPFTGTALTNKDSFFRREIFLAFSKISR